MPRWTTAAVALAAAVTTASAQIPGRPPDEGAGVQTRRGDGSPTGGFSAGQTNSRIDDDHHQDEQVDIDPGSGVVKVLRVDQKNLVNDFVTAVYPLRRVVPRELRDVFRVVCGKEGGTAEVILAPDGSAWMQVITTAHQLPWIERALERLDVDWISQVRDGSASLHFRANYRPTASVDPFAASDVSGATAFDPTANALVRRDEPYRIGTYIERAGWVDIPRPQAMLKFKIYEVDTNNDLKLGVDWIAWKNGPGRSLFEVLYSSQDSHHSPDNASSPYDGNLGSSIVFGDSASNLHRESTQVLLSANYLLTSAYLDFLRVKGKSRVLAEPEIFTLTGIPASWSSIDQILGFQVTPDDPDAFGIVPVPLNTVNADVPEGTIPDAWETSSANGPDWPAAHDRFLNHSIRGELGVFLDVTAVIGTESSEVQVRLESTDLAGTTPQGTPIITNRIIDTKMRLVDGQPFVFGGLTREEDVESSNKAPWLGDIPVLGYLFGQETTSARRKELVITCVPHFYQGCPAEITDAVEIDTISMATGEKEIPVPESSFGFDAWLFDALEP